MTTRRTSPNGRTAAEQKFWDTVATTVVRECAMRSRAAQGCARYAAEVADELLGFRRISRQRDR